MLSSEPPCCCLVSCVRLFCNPRTAGCQALLSVGFPRQEYWSGLSFPSPGDLPDPGTEPAFFYLLHCQVDSLPLHHQGSLLKHMLAGKQVCISNDHFVFIRTCYFFSYLCCSRDIQRGRVKYIEEYISDLHFKKVPSRNKDDLGNLEIWILVRKLVKELPWWANG